MVSVVVGSGPTGVSAARALLERGEQVLMLDVGRILEDSNKALRDGLAKQPPAEWSPKDRAEYIDAQFGATPGQTRRFGSDFAMQPAADTFSNRADRLALRASHARGGLSNLWGSAVLPYRQADISDWPITLDDLAAHYRTVAGFMPVAAGTDEFDKTFDLSFATHSDRPPNSIQADEILRRLAGAAKSGPCQIGPARVAVSKGCTACGLCLAGCPWGFIWSANSALDEMKHRDGFTYRADAEVSTIAEDKDGVTVHLSNGETVRAQRLYMATGVLETARILLRSGVVPDRLLMKDSQQAFLPMLHHWSLPRDPSKMPLTTLPQMFAELDDPGISPHLIHSQIYSWNDAFLRDLDENYGGKFPFSGRVTRFLSKRLIVAQIFLHSDHSSNVELRLDANGKLAAKHEPNSQTASVMARARKAVARAFAPAGLHALHFATRMGDPGSSFHCGSTLPMAELAGPGQSDQLGRPQGLSRVHVVDASVLPSIPATTITFSAMANAHRIAATAV